MLHGRHVDESHGWRGILLYLVLFLILLSPASRAATLTEAQIVGEADARIERYRKSDATLRLIGPDGRPLAVGTRVRLEQTRHEFLFGCNLFALNSLPSRRLNEAYAQRFAELFNFATLPFYWWTYEKESGWLNERRIQTMIEWCRAHGVTTKGHPLVWNYRDPRWLPESPAEVKRLQLARITREMKRFQDGIQIWDVANELTETTRTMSLRDSPHLTRMMQREGVDRFGREAFQIARRANPRATLLINDYVMTQAYAENVIERLVDEQGRPLYDAIGLQSHQHGDVWPPQRIWNNCERFTPFKRPLHFTETTLISGKNGSGLTEKDPTFKWVSTPEGEQRQAEQVARFYTILFSHPAVEAITWWDFSDRNSWMKAPAGLIRQDMSPKPAYDALMKLIKGKWWTKETKAVGGNEKVSFRGFRGEYRVTVRDAGGRMLTGEFKLGRHASGIMDVKLQIAK